MKNIYLWLKEEGRFVRGVAGCSVSGLWEVSATLARVGTSIKPTNPLSCEKVPLDKTLN